MKTLEVRIQLNVLSHRLEAVSPVTCLKGIETSIQDVK